MDRAKEFNDVKRELHQTILAQLTAPQAGNEVSALLVQETLKMSQKAAKRTPETAKEASKSAQEMPKSAPEVAKQGRLDQMLFFSAPLMTREPLTGRDRILK